MPSAKPAPAAQVHSPKSRRPNTADAKRCPVTTGCGHRLAETIRNAGSNIQERTKSIIPRATQKSRNEPNTHAVPAAPADLRHAKMKERTKSGRTSTGHRRREFQD